jgi:hypothetical protein
MAAQGSPHPLLAALPPAVDHLSYLTIVEYNLTEENLPILHQVLQDTDLTAHIGWDLVQLLVPLLPASEECLQDIAERGNPREVILKVTEALRLLELEEPEASSDGEDSNPTTANPSLPADDSGVESTEPCGPSTDQSSQTPPLWVLQFDVLLSVLSTLHGRIKTKYPSRFLSTSLQGVLAAYGRAKSHMDEVTLSAVKLVKTLSGTKRPHLPPRTASGNLLRAFSGNLGPDPEAHSDSPSAEESLLCNKLLQSFITHILEDYVLSLSSEHDIPGLAWSSRLMEKFHPERLLPGKPTYAKRFSEEEGLKARSAMVGQLVAVAQDLGLRTQDLLNTIISTASEEVGLPGEDSEPPSSADEIPLSKTGSLFLFAARKVSEELFRSTTTDPSTEFCIFPHHATLVKNFVGTLGIQTIGLESEALLDACLCLGLIALEKDLLGEPVDDEEFEHHLRALSLISANTASPSLRYQAHYLASTILRSHPSDLVRLSFIRNTLEDCPYENLKASAVGWLKGEILEANMQSMASHGSAPPSPRENSTESIFATPVAIGTVFPFLFPDLHEKLETSEVEGMWMQFRMDLGFYLAALNFYYLLLTAEPLHRNLNIPNLHENGGIEKSYLEPLRASVGRFRAALSEGGQLSTTEDSEGVQAQLMDLMILEDVLDRVEKAAKALSTASI